MLDREGRVVSETELKDQWTGSSLGLPSHNA